MNNIELFKDYENAKLTTAEEYARQNKERTVSYSALSEQNIDGIPICVRRDADGQLQVTFIEDTHLLAIGATRSGKTTGYVIPTLNVLLNKKNKPSLVISDPKQELYRSNAQKFADKGYRVLMLDFTNYMHSDCWNPLTKYYRAYQKYLNVGASVKVVQTEHGSRNEFQGIIYENQEELDLAIAEVREGYVDEVEKGITALAGAIIPTQNTKDPFWEDSARDLLMAVLYGMLEDSETGIVTEDNFSFDTVMRIFDTFTDANENDYDKGYFTSRPLATSRAHQLAHKCIIEQAKTTRRCISSSFITKMNKFRDTAVRRITCANTFEISQLDDGAPTVIFLSYKDEESLHYEVISMFLSNLYTELIGVSRKKGTRLQRPFYFLLDEFGNLPKFNDFDKVISACAGRNIWFLLILQSYAQLYNIYGKETAEIIKDNLNTHVFFGTNNPETKREFSEECGRKTIIAPTSALNGSGEAIERFEKDTVALVPVSMLTKLNPGECIVTQMREDVLWSRIERSYTCPEFSDDQADPDARQPKLRFSDAKYTYVHKKRTADKQSVASLFDF
ncbi:MAG: type IV secretory system conjugative DNA transfer family protein [Ruminococcaceae bacterium]|nr:type IV secretory system conjugative DNA transfer family protein [Oscillospiraceae bacterium]